MAGSTKKTETDQRTMNRRPEIEECREIIAANISPQTGTEEVSLADCAGRVAAEDVTAGMMVPPYPKSAMDGYAVRAEEIRSAAADSPVTLRVAGELFAGDFQEISYEPGTAVRVMTGALIPDGYDAVVRQEDTDYGMEQVKICAPVQAYANYCRIGEDIERGALVIEKNTRLRPFHAGLLASVGRASVKVYQPAKIALISTGTELAEAGFALAPGKIYNSIAYMLAASIRSEGLIVERMETCPDDETLLASKLREALESADFVITTGGVSVGKRDIVPGVLERMGAGTLFRRANIQPGTPTLASVLDGKVILSLSGNPYAALANFELYFRRAMAAFMQNLSYDIKTADAVLKSEYNKVNRMRRLLRAYADNGEVTIPSGVHASSVIHNLAECNCFIDLEAGRSVKPGDSVRILYFKDRQYV